MSDLNELIEANRELIERASDPQLESHLRRAAELMLTIALEDRHRLVSAATCMMNCCGGRRSDAIRSEARQYHRDPVKWREARLAEEDERRVAREQKRADEIETAAILHRQREARLAAADRSA